MKYGEVEVPWTAEWSGEDRFELRPCRWADGKIAVWQSHLPGQGKPRFAKPHMVRQRQAMARCLCDLCGERLDSPDRVSLSQERAVHIPKMGLYPLVVEPLLHRECARRSAEQCPNLRAQIAEGRIWVREVRAFQLVAQLLTGEATMEFANAFRPGTVGHLKLAITSFTERDAAWLETRNA